jgi:hypothetical protein
MDRQRRRVLAALGSVSVATLAGCGGDDGDDSDDEGSGTDTPPDGRTDAEGDADGGADTPTDAGTESEIGEDGATDSANEDGNDSDQQATQPFQQQVKLTADDGDDEDNFGKAVAITGDGSTTIVGADGDEDPNGEGAGSAYVFE